MIHVRRALPEERKELEKLIRRCGKHVADYFNMRHRDEYWRDGEVWAAVLEGASEPLFVGFAVIHPLKREPVLSLYDIGVDPRYRGLGYATRLMSSAQVASPSHDRIRLVVSVDNTIAQQAYVAWGLSFVERKETRSNGWVAVFEGTPRWLR